MYRGMLEGDSWRISNNHLDSQVNQKQCQPIPKMECTDVTVPVETCEDVTEQVCEDVRLAVSLHFLLL